VAHAGREPRGRVEGAEQGCRCSGSRETVSCPLLLTKCHIGFDGNVQENTYVCLRVRGIHTMPCSRSYRTCAQCNGYGFVGAGASSQRTPCPGCNPPWPTHWRAIESPRIPHEPPDPRYVTENNPHGNPPVTCVHCHQDVPWPDRESCPSCSGFVHALCITMFACAMATK